MTNVKGMLQNIVVMMENIKRTQHTSESFVLEFGQGFNDDPFTDEEERLIIEFFNFDCAIKQCFYNNQVAQLRHSYDDLDGIFQYCEGYVDTKVGIPVLHAFSTINNKVVDITIRKDDDENIITRARENRKRNSYAGVAFDSKKVIRKMLAVGESFSVLDNWQDGFPVLTGKHEEWLKY